MFITHVTPLQPHLHFFPAHSPIYLLSPTTLQAIANFITRTAKTAPLPLDFYRILSVSSVGSKDSLTRAYERRLKEVPEEAGYTKKALSARAAILKGALDTLLDPSARMDYDARLRLGEVLEDVPAEYVPGVIMLLQEAQDWKTAIAAGEQWLSVHRKSPLARDVALATALAHCDAASACLEAAGGIQRATGMLEVARDLLRKYCLNKNNNGAATGAMTLQQRISDALAELQPQLAVELLALPLEAADQRARGLALAKAVLPRTQIASSSAQQQQQQVLQSLTSCLTAMEAIELYQSCGPSYASTSPQLYAVALALIADAIFTKQLSRLAEAETLLIAADNAPLPDPIPEFQKDRRTAEELSRRSIAKAVTHLLRGDVPQAEEVLGVHARMQPACGRQVVSFIRSNSPDREDLLPGICVLAQRWIQDVVLTSYRSSSSSSSYSGKEGGDTGGTAADLGFTLDGWFDNASVKRQLAGQGGNTSTLATAVVGALRGIVQLPVAGYKKATGMLFSAKPRSVGVVERKAAAEEGEVEIVGGGVKKAQETDAASPPPAPSAIASVGVQEKILEPKPMAVCPSPPPLPPPPPSTLLPKRVAPRPVEENKKQGTTTNEDDEVNPFLLSARESLKSNKDILYIDDDGDDDASADFLTRPVLPSEINTLVGEEAMLRAFEAKHVRWDRLVAAAAIFAGISFFGVRTVLNKNDGMMGTGTTVAAAAMTDGNHAMVMPTSKEATALLQRWQIIKAQALGSSHDSSNLATVLKGDILKQWMDRAASVKTRGWSYSHSLDGGIKLTSIAPTGNGGEAVVVASLVERVTVNKGDGTSPQTFVSDYSVKYQMEKQQEGGQWVIVAAEVLA
jgi:hypothetical protein